jgi:MerR family mercuric resistance operon transcriptional regulator
MTSTPETLTIGAFAKAAGVNVETIRFYQRKGLLPEPERPVGGIRRYGPTDVDRVKFVKSAQRLGFNLEEVAQLLKLEDGTHCHEAADLAAVRLEAVRLRLTDLQRMESALSHLVQACSSSWGKVTCPLIASLHRHMPTD